MCHIDQRAVVCVAGYYTRLKIFELTKFTFTKWPALATIDALYERTWWPVTCWYPATTHSEKQFLDKRDVQTDWYHTCFISILLQCFLMFAVFHFLLEISYILYSSSKFLNFSSISYLSSLVRIFSIRSLIPLFVNFWFISNLLLLLHIFFIMDIQTLTPNLWLKGV